MIEQRLGFPLRLVRDRRARRRRARAASISAASRFDADADGLIADPDVAIVIELIGGYDAARRLILRSIEAGKHVVTANKALLALHGAEIFGAAARRGVDVAFEASVAGGIPILRSIREGLVANRIESVHGIVNGTTNYVLTQMERTGEPQEVVVKRAQELGYAEADPTFDLDGIDAAHKLTLLVAMAFGAELTFKEIPTEGIRGIVPVDFEAAEEFGYRIKLLGIAKSRGDGGRERIEARVHPTLIPRDEPARERRRRDERDRGHGRRGRSDALLRRRRGRAADRERGGRGSGRDRARDPARRRGARRAALVSARVAARRCRSCRSASSRDAPTCASPRSTAPACSATSRARSASTGSASSR